MLKEADMIFIHSTFKIVYINIFVRTEAFLPSVKNRKEKVEAETQRPQSACGGLSLPHLQWPTSL